MPRRVRSRKRKRYVRGRTPFSRRTRRRFMRRRRYRIPASIQPLKPLRTLRYVDNIQINPTAGFAANHLFRAASLFDPDFTGTGHQPLGFDNFNNLYLHYTVVGSKITAKFFSPTGGTGNQVIGQCGIYLSPNASTEADPRVLMENKQGRWSVFSDYTGGKPITTVRHGFSPKKYFGMKSLVGDERFTSFLSENPQEDMYYNVWAGPVDGTSDMGSINVQVTIEYLAVFTERKTLGIN